MKKINIAFSGYGDSFLGLPFDQNYLIDVLSERYDVSVTSVPDADYVSCGICGKPYEYCGIKVLIRYRYRNLLSLAERIGGGYPKNWLKNKEYFTNFIASHDSEKHYRTKPFNKLSRYKRSVFYDAADEGLFDSDVQAELQIAGKQRSGRES